MRQIIIFLTIITGLAINIHAQTERKSIAEQFTSSTCGPCGIINPGFDALLQANSDKITSIKYHMSWPAPGNDPMYHHNPTDNNARRTYYNVNTVPHVQIDGPLWSGNPGSVNQSHINNASSQPSPFVMQLHHELNEDETVINVSIMIEAEEAVDAGLTLHNVVIEKHIHFNSPPGTNGETDFYNVMKKMLPTSGGTELDAFAAGDYIILEGSWTHENVYDIEELAAVGFIQNNLSKEVFYAEISSEENLTPLYSLDADVVSTSNFTTDNCTGMLNPLVVIRNNGEETLTSATIKYHVNGEEVHTFDWTGNLGSFEKVEIELPEFTFSILEENEFVIYIEEPNGQTDMYPKNDTLTTIINKAAVTDDEAKLTLKLDDHPEETSWEIVNSMGEVVYSGGDYTQGGQFIQETFTFEEEDCYTIFIYDAGGNGFGTGGFVTFHVGGELIMQEMGDWGSELENQFEYASFVGVEENHDPISMEMFPNPAENHVQLNVYTSNNHNLDLQLLDLTGKALYKESLAGNSGYHTVNIDLSSMDNGVYFVMINDGVNKKYEKLIVQK